MGTDAADTEEEVAAKNTVTILNMYRTTDLILYINDTLYNSGQDVENSFSDKLDLKYITTDGKYTFKYSYKGLDTSKTYTLAIFVGKLIHDEARLHASAEANPEKEYIGSYFIDNIEHVGKYNSYSDDISINYGANLFVLLLENKQDFDFCAGLLLPVINDNKKKKVIDPDKYVIVIPLTPTFSNTIIYNMYNTDINLNINNIQCNILYVNGPLYPEAANIIAYDNTVSLFNINFDNLSVTYSNTKATPTTKLANDKKYVFVVFSGQKRSDDYMFDSLTDLNGGTITSGNSLLLAIFEESESTEAEYRTFFRDTVSDRLDTLTKALKEVVAFEAATKTYNVTIYN
jgi:hypothetical protein